MKLHKLLSYSYIFFVVALFFYSYTQVDLSLTLARASIFQAIEKAFQYIGYFQRPVSTALFLIIISSLFILYIWILRLVEKGQFSRRDLWLLILISVAIVTFSYNAFSYDFFNYIFYGKIITHYHQNPYIVKALDFSHEPMLSFMHWTQNTYPYGPFFLALITPLSFIGFNFFLVTFFLFKIFTSLCLLGSIYFLEKILKRVFPNIMLLGVAFFALNPLSLIEGGVSSHNDIVMMFFAILGMFLLITRKRILGLLSLIASWQTKEATAFILIPSAIYFINSFFKKQILNEKLYIRLCGIFMLLAFGYLATFREIQPWYFLWILPFTVAITKNKYVLSTVIGFSFGLLLRYVPFLYQGNWDGSATAIKYWVTIISPIVFLGVYVLFRLFIYAKRKYL